MGGVGPQPGEDPGVGRVTGTHWVPTAPRAGGTQRHF